MQQVLADLTAAAKQLPGHPQNHEASVVATVLRKQAERKRAPVAIGNLLTAVLARLGVNTHEVNETNSSRTEDRP